MAPIAANPAEHLYRVPQKTYQSRSSFVIDMIKSTVIIGNTLKLNRIQVFFDETQKYRQWRVRYETLSTAGWRRRLENRRRRRRIAATFPRSIGAPPAVPQVENPQSHRTELPNALRGLPGPRHRR